MNALHHTIWCGSRSTDRPTPHTTRVLATKYTLCVLAAQRSVCVLATQCTVCVLARQAWVRERCASLSLWP